MILVTKDRICKHFIAQTKPQDFSLFENLIDLYNA